MSGREIIKLLEQNGWQLDRIKGSHHVMNKEGERSIAVPVHGNKDLKTGIVQQIMKDGGLK